MADLIERLRYVADDAGGHNYGVSDLLREAAAAIEAEREDADKWAILSMRRGDWLELDIAMEEAEAVISVRDRYNITHIGIKELPEEN